MNPILVIRRAILSECRERYALDPREKNVSPEYNVSITLTIAEIRAFLEATKIARTAENEPD